MAAWLLVLSLIALHNNVRPRLHDAPACCAQQHHAGCACLAAAGQGISGAGQAHIARQGPTQPALLCRSKTWASMSFDPEALKVRVGASAQQCDGADRTPAGIAGLPILLTFPIFYLLQKRVVQQQKGSRIEEVQVQVGGRERGLIWCCSQYVAAALTSVCAQPVWNEGANHPAPLQVTFHMYPKILVSLLPRHLSFKAGPFARLSAMFFAWLQCNAVVALAVNSSGISKRLYTDATCSSLICVAPLAVATQADIRAEVVRNFAEAPSAPGEVRALHGRW